MSRQIQIRRGTKNQHASFTGAIGEVTMDTTNNTLRVHDGVTLGGNEMLSRNSFYSYITNCITEIPQNIKLELNNGTLTLKAGSKVYVPNGAGVFNTVTIANDLTVTASSNGKTLICVQSNGSGLVPRISTKCVSGTTRSLTDTYMLWYDTANNVVNNYSSNSTTPAHTVSLPIAITTVSNGAFSSIDQVFNGFGYIGSTVFALPGVRGLIPNGRNEDGTFKNNSVFNYSSVKTITPGDGDRIIVLSKNSVYFDTPLKNAYKYDKQVNFNKRISDGVDMEVAVVGSFKKTSGVISDFTTKTTFYAVDYNDTEYIAHQAMPSDKYVDLTLPASGGTITAPADGYLALCNVSNGANERIQLITTVSNIGISETSSGSNAYLRVFIPLRKGQVCQVLYSTTGANVLFRFIYANGVK